MDQQQALTQTKELAEIKSYLRRIEATDGEIAEVIEIAETEPAFREAWLRDARKLFIEATQ